MVTTLQSIQIILALAIIILVLIQQPSNDASSTPVGSEGSFMHTRRGAERFFYLLTIITAVLFAAVSLAVVVLLS